MVVSEENLEFIKRIGESVEILFDATGLSKSEYKSEMKTADKLLAIGVTPCARGHALRTRHGHCVICNPTSIGIIKRYHADSSIYIAGSIQKQCLKIGLSSDVYKRKYSLKDKSYLGANDWEILYHIKCANAGKIENEVHKKLEQYRVKAPYDQGGVAHESSEFFKCSFETALGTLNMVLLSKGILLESAYLSDSYGSYLFREASELNAGARSKVDRTVLRREILDALKDGVARKAHNIAEGINKSCGYKKYTRKDINSVLYRDMEKDVLSLTEFKWKKRETSVG